MNSKIREALSWLEIVSVRFRPKSADVYERVLEFSQDFERLQMIRRRRSGLLVKKLLTRSCTRSVASLQSWP